MDVVLRPYQIDLVAQIREAFRTHRRVLAVAPTGSGKTTIFSYVTKYAAAKGNRTIIAAHRQEICDQISGALDRMGVRHGRIQPGHTMTADPVQVGMVQTIARRLDQVAAPDLLVIDECVSGDAIIDTDIGPVRLRDVPNSKARSVMSYDGTDAVWRNIVGWKYSGLQRTMRLHMNDGSSIVCTPDHLLYVDGQWTEARLVKIGMKLTSNAASAHADVAHPCFAMFGAGQLPSCPAIATRASQSSIGMHATWPQSQTRRYAHADVASTSSLPQNQQMNFAAFIRVARGIHASFVAMTSGPNHGDLSFPLWNDSKFSERCLGIALLAFQTIDPLTGDWHGPTAKFRPGGYTTKPLRFTVFAQLSRLCATRGLGKFPCGWYLHAFPAFHELRTWSRQLDIRLSQKGGWISLVMPVLRGGIAMTGLLFRSVAAVTLFCILKGIPKKNSQLSSNGLVRIWAKPHKSETVLTDRLLNSHEAQPGSFSTASTGTCQTACVTSLVTVARIEDHAITDVYDISVEGTHCFFANGLLVHNCHHAVAGTWRTVSDAWPTVKILGVTATPQRLDGKGLSDAFDTMIVGPGMAELIAGGYLAKFRYLAPPQRVDLSAIKTRMGDYAIDQLSDAMNKRVITGDAVDHYRQYLDGRPAVVFCVSVAHAEAVAAQFREAGYRAASVDGKTDRITRRSIINSLGDGRLQVLTSCELISEGVDIPVVAGAILLRPTQSLGMFLQQIGRALRIKPDGGDAMILDHVGNIHRHGMPDMAREWSLDAKKKKPREAPVSTCESCFRVFAVSPGWKAAAECGQPRDLAGMPPMGCILTEMPEAKASIEQEEGMLTEITVTPTWAGGLDIVKAPLKEALRAARTREQLQEIATARGYKPQWVHFIWKQRAAFRARKAAA